MRHSGTISVLIVDDSKVFCELAARGIEEDKQINVIGFAGDPFAARDKILELEPDVLILDIEMPKMDGLTFLKKLMPQYPLPTIVVSGREQNILKALEAGAVDYVQKPGSYGAENTVTFMHELIVKIKIASMANVSAYKSGCVAGVSGEGKTIKSGKVIAIGASTGGTEAIYAVLKDLPKNMPGIVIVQHMPENFTKMYAERLNSSCRMAVMEAKDGDYVEQGKVLLAPGGYHMKLLKSEGGYRVNCFMEEKVNGHRPSVDVLFNSVAKNVGSYAVGVILTGMGYDGAKGILEMRRKGAYTIGQDENTSIVYGMPKVAYDIGGIDEQLPLNRIAQKLSSLVYA